MDIVSLINKYGFPIVAAGPCRCPCPGGRACRRPTQRRVLLAKNPEIKRDSIPLPFPIGRQDPEVGHLHHRRGPQAVMARPWPLLALILLAGPATAATVLSVGDGDTIRVADGPQRLTIRLACIDAPEMAQAPYGAASREYLQGLAPVGSVVTIRPQTKDRYGRTVAEVFRNGRAVNLAMVQSGQAFAYRKYLAACNGGAYLAAEAQAKQEYQAQENQLKFQLQLSYWYNYQLMLYQS